MIIKRCFFGLVMSMAFFSFSFAGAEIKVIEKEVVETVGSDQSIEQVEAFALQKAKRLAVEEAGTYISSLTVVKNFQLEKDEITALASGVVQANIVGVPERFTKDNIFHVRVKAVIQVDTSVLDRQIAEIMKEKDTLKKLEEERKKNKELEEKLASLKSNEVKRLEELNAQTIALERERDRRRAELEQASLAAQSELKKAQIERLQKEREMQDRTQRLITEQENARKAEAEALAREQDQLKRTQMENEIRWSDLVRKSKLTQEQWVAIDDSLSLQQAMEEAKQIKKEIADLRQRMKFEYDEARKNLERSFDKQISLTVPSLPPEPKKEKDPFEKQYEYEKRLADYEQKVQEANRASQEKIEPLEKEKKLRIIEAEIKYLENKSVVLEPFLKRLQELANRKFILPEGAMNVSMGEPDAEHDRFPLELGYKDERWRVYWGYRDRDNAKDLWKTRGYLKADGLFQLAEAGDGVDYQLTGSRVSHPGMGDSRDFELVKPSPFSEVNALEGEKSAIADLKEKEKKAEWNFIIIGCYEEAQRGDQFILFSSGIVLDSNTGLEWMTRPDKNRNWKKTKRWVDSLTLCGGGWRMPTMSELKRLYQIGKSPSNMTPLLMTTGCLVWSGKKIPSGALLSGPDALFYDFCKGRPYRSGLYASKLRGFAVRSRR